MSTFFAFQETSVPHNVANWGSKGNVDTKDIVEMYLEQLFIDSGVRVYGPRWGWKLRIEELVDSIHPPIPSAVYTS